MAYICFLCYRVQAGHNTLLSNNSMLFPSKGVTDKRVKVHLLISLLSYWRLLPKYNLTCGSDDQQISRAFLSGKFEVVFLIPWSTHSFSVDIG